MDKKFLLILRWLFGVPAVIAVSIFYWGCSDDKNGSGGDGSVDLPSCLSEDLFSEHAVPLSSISYLAPIGTMAPVGGSPLPKAHTGYMLNAANVSITAPGDLLITSVRKTTYIVSPTRPGYVDYAVFFDVCKEVGGHFGHLSSLSAAISSQLGSMNCSQYTTVDETIESCSVNVKISVLAGEALGTAGTLPHSPALDMGMQDSRLSDYVNPSRYAFNGKGTLCPWDWFVDPVKTSLYPLIGDGVVTSTETPQCGTMDVDQDGTAKGRWTLASAPADGTDPTAPDFFVLAPNPYAGTSQVVISTRIAALNTSSLPEFTLEASGRLNIAPASITADGLIYCYDTDLTTSTFSYLVQMISSSVLRVEKMTHTAGDSVCNGAPGTWTFTGSAVDLIR